MKIKYRICLDKYGCLVHRFVGRILTIGGVGNQTKTKRRTTIKSNLKKKQKNLSKEIRKKTRVTTCALHHLQNKTSNQIKTKKTNKKR